MKMSRQTEICIDLLRIFENGRYKRIGELPEKNLLEFLSYLMHDWKCTEPGSSNYSMNEKWKSILDKTKINLFDDLIDMLKSEENPLFHYYLYRALHQLIHEITNDEKNSDSNKHAIPAKRPDQYDQYLKHIKNGEFQGCLKLTLVGISLYQFGYAFKEKTTNEKFKLLEHIFSCNFSSFESAFKEYVEKEKLNSGTYYEIALRPLITFYYNIAQNANVKSRTKTYQFIQNLLAHNFPEVKRNSFLITKFDDQRYSRIFDDSEKYKDKIKNVFRLVILCRVAMRLEVLGFPTGVIEHDKNMARLLFKEEFEECTFGNMFNTDEVTAFIEEHGGDFLQSTDVSEIVKKIQDIVKILMNLEEPDNRIAIFGRNSARPESLFEIILSIPEMSTKHDNFFEIIWDKFDLNKTPAILQVKNHLGKSIFNYVIASNGPWNLIKFITKLRFYKYFDYEFEGVTGFNLFEYYVKLSMLYLDDEDLLSTYVNDIILYLLEEYDIARLPIKTALDLTEKDYIEVFGIRNYQNVLDPCPRLCLKGKIAADYMLCLIVAYCNPERLPKDFIRRLSYNNPIANLLLMIISGEESKCVDGFHENMIKVEDYLKRLRYISDQPEDTPSSKYIALFKITMFMAAIINNRRRVMDKIFESENFATMNFKFPSNMKSYDGSSYAAMKLIDSNGGDVMSKFNFPKTWTTAKEFGKLLDSRIKLSDSRIEIDSTFLINSDLKEFNVSSGNNSVDVDSLILYDDTETLQRYYQNEGVKESVTHPVIAIYVALKWFKYRRIFVFNFWIFVLQLVGYALFVFGKIGRKYENCDSNWCISSVLQTYFQFQTMLTIAYMVGREFFQFRIMNKRSFYDHFSNLENILECLLVITIACTFLVGSREILVYLASFNIFVMMLIIITMFPYSFMYFYMQMFRKAVATFVKFFLTFAILLLTFVIVFAIIFNLSLPKNTEIQTNQESAIVETNDFVRNFDNIGDAVLKVILMLSGEYSIDPFDLNMFQLIVFSLFVIVTIILFNLIIGLVMDGVQKFGENANKVVVRQQIEAIVKTDRIFRDFYSEISRNVKQNSKRTRLNRVLDSIRYHSMEFFINKYPHLHKIDKIYIDLKKLKVEMFVGDTFKCAVEFSFRSFDIERFLGRKCFQINNEHFEKINQILNNRCDEG